VPHDVHGHGEHRSHIAERSRHDQGIPSFGQMAELCQVLFSHTELHCLVPPRYLDGTATVNRGHAATAIAG
jgi:hypothetical protein